MEENKPTMEERYKALKNNIAQRYGKIDAPEEKPKFPHNLSALKDDDVVNWLAHFTEWQVYAGVQVGETDANRKVAEALYRNQRSRKMIAYAKDKRRKFEIDAEIDDDPEMQKFKERWQYHEAAYSLENSYKEGFEKYCFVLSRELTRRLNGEEVQFRKDRFGHQENRINHDELESAEDTTDD